jgi:hypothetical protein
VPAYLDEEFLDRVRRAYRTALRVDLKATGPIWSAIDARRADVHAALLDDTNTRLRQIFADPTFITVATVYPGALYPFNLNTSSRKL